MAQPVHGTLTEPAAEHGGGFPPFRPDTFASQLLWLAITFGALYWLMSKVALPRVEDVLKARSERIGGELEEAHRMRTQSEEAGAAYEKALADARDKAKGIAQQSRDQLAAESDARRKALEADLAGKLAAAEATIRSGTEAAMANVRGIASDAAAAIVERLTGRAPESATLQAALDRSVKA